MTIDSSTDPVMATKNKRIRMALESVVSKNAKRSIQK